MRQPFKGRHSRGSGNPGRQHGVSLGPRFRGGDEIKFDLETRSSLMARNQLRQRLVRLVDAGMAAPPIHRHVDGLDAAGIERGNRLMHVRIGQVVDILAEIIPHHFFLPVMRQHVEREEDAGIGMRRVGRDRQIGVAALRHVVDDLVVDDVLITEFQRVLPSAGAIEHQGLELARSDPVLAAAGQQPRNLLRIFR